MRHEIFSFQEWATRDDPKGSWIVLKTTQCGAQDNSYLARN
jgi:hypothetical protein